MKSPQPKTSHNGLPHASERDAHQESVEQLRRAIDVGDAAYARGDFTTYASPGQFAEDLKARLRTRLSSSRD